MKRVVVTGVGGWSCLGTSFAETWRKLQDQEVSAAKPVTSFDASKFPTTFACEAALGPDGIRPDIVAMATAAAREALKEADYETLPSKRAQWFMGLGMGTPNLDWLSEVVLKENFDAALYKDHIRELPSCMGEEIARAFTPRLPVQIIHTACASAALAIGEAFLALTSGELDVAVAGGADAMVQPLQLAGLSCLGALSKRNDAPQYASRPFASTRDGFVIGDGAAILILETLDAAQERGARILAEIVGYGCTGSGFRITDLHPEGKGIREAMIMALDMAHVAPGDVDYINAHGTSTLPNDAIESAVIHELFPDSTTVSSTKSIVGHLMAAAGAIEMAFCVKSMAEQVQLPSLFRDDQDPACKITLTPGKPAPRAMEYMLSNSIGFGGSNAALVLRRGGDHADD